jgi:hypothetical protein
MSDEPSIDDAIATLIAERSAPTAPPMTLSQAVMRVCQLLGIETPGDVFLPEFRKRNGDFPEFFMRHIIWDRLLAAAADGSRHGITEDSLQDAVERVFSRCYDLFWLEHDPAAYTPDVVVPLLAEELGRAPYEHEIRKMLRRAHYEERTDRDTFGFLGHAGDVLDERAERGVPNLTVDDVKSEAIRRMDG